MLAPEPVVALPLPALRDRRTFVLLTGLVLLVAGLAVAGWAAGTKVLVTRVRMLVLVAGLLTTIAGLGRVARAVRGRPVDVVFWLGMAWLVLILGAAALAPWLPLGNADDSVKGLTSPIFAPPGGLGAEHPLGTNNYGLDVLARAVYGARTSILVALLAVLIGTTVGGLVGLVSGFVRGATDRVVGILANAQLAGPPHLLLIARGTVLDPSVRSNASNAGAAFGPVASMKLIET